MSSLLPTKMPSALGKNFMDKHEGTFGGINDMPIVEIGDSLFIKLEDYLKADKKKNEKIKNIDKALDQLEVFLKANIFKLHRITGPNFTSVGQSVYEEVLKEVKRLKKEYKLDGDDSIGVMDKNTG